MATAGGSVVAALQRVARDRERMRDCAGSLPPAVYATLARLVSDYSLHRGTRTVTVRRGGELVLTPEAAITDGSLDTYIDNGPVSRAYACLTKYLLECASSMDEEGDDFARVARLYACVCGVRGDACNQANALTVAALLLEMVPVGEEKEAGGRSRGRGGRAGNAKERRRAARDAARRAEGAAAAAAASSEVADVDALAEGLADTTLSGSE